MFMQAFMGEIANNRAHEPDKLRENSFNSQTQKERYSIKICISTSSRYATTENMYPSN